MFEKSRERLLSWAVKGLTAPGQMLPFFGTQDPQWSKWTTGNAVREGLKANIFVYSCINTKAKAAASVPWKVYRQNTEGVWEEVKRHPLELLIDKPNPFMGRKDLIERMVHHLELGGNSLHQKILVSGVPVELWALNPDKIKPLPDKQEFIKGYEYEYDNRKKTIPAEEIMHNMYVDPGNIYWGLAPLQVAAKTVDTDTEAVSWNKVALQNRAVTDGVFSFDQPLNREQWLDARRMIREQHQGQKSARAPWVLGSGAQWNQMALSPADMDFIEGRKMTREEICSIFNVPPPMVGILDKANYANMKEARRVFWLDTVIPLLEDIKSSLNQSLTPHFAGNETLEIDYDVSNVEAIQDNFGEKVNTAKTLWSMGIPLNEVNQRLELGFDEVEGGDIGYLPTGIIPSQLAASMSESEPMPDEREGSGAKAKKLYRVPSLIIPKPTEIIAEKGYNLQSEEQKTIYWKSFERQRLSWYALMTRRANGMFEEERKRVISQGDDLGAVLNAVESGPWRTFYVRHYQAIVEAFGTRAMEDFKSYIGPNERKVFTFDPWDDDIQRYIQSRAARKVTLVTEETKKQIRTLHAKYQRAGSTVESFAEMLDLTFKNFSTYRSFRIARTEVVAASNYGSIAAAVEASIEMNQNLEKEWVSSRDDRVRDTDEASHVDMDGERVMLHEHYSNGLMYPGDMDAGNPAEVVHCRCTQAYHF